MKNHSKNYHFHRFKVSFSPYYLKIDGLHEKKWKKETFFTSHKSVCRRLIQFPKLITSLKANVAAHFFRTTVNLHFASQENCVQ